MQAYAFVVDTTPYCLWDWEIRETNLRFLDSVDAAYFSSTARILAGAVEGEGRHHAALALRLTYFQALETFFAFLCALVQAPHAPVGWLARYRPAELRSVVKKLLDRHLVLTRLNVPLTFEHLSDAVHQFQLEDPEATRAIKAGYAACWRRLAKDLTDRKSADEYNSAKHGIRVHSGGFSVAAGLEHEPGVPAPPEKMQVIGASEYGSMYLFAEPVAKPSLNVRVKTVTRAWDPFALVGAIEILSFSISNVVGVLKILSGRSPTEVRFTWPAKSSAFDEPWKPKAGILDLQFNSTITAGDIAPKSRTEVLAEYAPKNKSESA